MAGQEGDGSKPKQDQEEEPEAKLREDNLLSSYLGLSFSFFLAILPPNSISLIPNLQTQIRDLSIRLLQAEEQLRQMKSRRKEDSKANARVVEIFASHRNAWQAEEKRLLQQIDFASEEVASLRAKFEDFEREREEWQGKIQDLEREVGEREEMIGFMSRNAVAGGGGSEFAGGEEESGRCGSGECYGGEEEQEEEEENGNFVYGQQYYEHLLHQQQQQQQGSDGGFSSDLLASASKFWSETASTLWQDMQFDSQESHYHMKHFVARRESPWKVDSDSTGVSSKLKLLEEELLNLEKVGKTDISKVPSLMRKQAGRYQSLSGKIDDLCRRMQASDPSEPTLGPEFRTRRQTEFLLEAFRLKERASKTAQKLVALQNEIGKSYSRDEVGNQAKLTMRRSFEAIRNNLKEVQRNLEIWLARIIGDLKGILARDGASCQREYYISRYPFVQ
ncbi:RIBONUCLEASE P PROTEIN SUBUNIT P38-LIKE PROTEIN [Salix viminalis]|uniref:RIBONUCLEASE P PROTEIN SUBUNIT P38-LIKE PROTEIN n=1 Tax=Salix viminalis TaxID=40686 RepID=A0A9Q0YYG6_SALVM|nr:RIBONUCLEASE P PROTEIN SUBUNIT P38-LIKE PROTEIN [Salix viminalis]